ncbi:MAG: methyltransferase domain-containing protein [Clostridia bacterium]|nr:methyltransferase domain-containing protein [Clostridia bacterium]
MRAYSDFAEFYDCLTQNVGYDKKADYLLELFKRHNHNTGITLDLACGTGTLTLELKKRGIDIYGIDASCEMLTIAQQKAFENGQNIMFICQKMQNLDLYGTIDTCICSLDSINHLTSSADVQKTFDRISMFMNPNGLFVFDANTVYKHKYVLGDNCYIYDTEKVFCAWQNNYNEKNNKVMITLDFFEPDGKLYRRSSEQFSERAYTRSEMTEMLIKAGFDIESVYDDMSFEVPKQNSEREIYVARKKSNE